MKMVLITVPLISALIGWFTNFLAVKMIFRPRKRFVFAGIAIQGLIPRRRGELADKIGETVEKELISHDDIHQAVNTEHFRGEILDSLMGTVERFIGEKLSGNPLLAMFLNADATTAITTTIRAELSAKIPDVMENMFEKVEENLDLKAIVKKRIEAFEIERLEEIICSIAAKELKAIEILGGVLGFIIGLVQVFIIRFFA